MKRFLLLFFCFVFLLSCKDDAPVPEKEPEEPEAPEQISLVIKDLETPVSIDNNTVFSYVLSLPEGYSGMVLWAIGDIEMPSNYSSVSQAYLEMDDISEGSHTLYAYVYMWEKSEERDSRSPIKEGEKPAKTYEYALEYNKPVIGENTVGLTPADGLSSPFYIYVNTMLYFNITVPTRSWVDLEYELGGQKKEEHLHLPNQPYGIPIYPEKLGSGDHKLTVTMRVKILQPVPSGGEIWGATVVRSFEYIIKAVETEKTINIRQGITDDGYLKVEWDKPQLEQIEVDRYEVEYLDMEKRGTVKTAIYDADQTSFVDTKYVYGHQFFRISTYFKGDRISSWQETHIVEYEELTSDAITFEAPAFGRLRMDVKLPPYNTMIAIWCKGVGSDDGQEPYNNTQPCYYTRDDFPLDFAAPLFPSSLDVEVLLMSAGSTDHTVQGSYSSRWSYQSYYTGTSYDSPRYPVASPYDNKIHILTRRGVITHDADTYAETERLDFPSEMIVELVVDRFSERKVIQDYYGDIWLYKNSRFDNRVSFKIDASGYDAVLGFTRDNRLLAFTLEAGSLRVVTAYDANTGKYLGKVTLAKEYDHGSWAYFFDKYLVVGHAGGYDVYQISGYTGTLLKSYSNAELYFTSFHYHNGNTYIIGRPGDTPGFIMVSLPDCRVVQSLDDEWVYCNTDPFTGNILFARGGMQNWRASVWNGDMSSELLLLDKVYTNDMLLFKSALYSWAYIIHQTYGRLQLSEFIK